jgi:hypothetical protein
MSRHIDQGYTHTLIKVTRTRKHTRTHFAIVAHTRTRARAHTHTHTHTHTVAHAHAQPHIPRVHCTHTPYTHPYLGACSHCFVYHHTSVRYIKKRKRSHCVVIVGAVSVVVVVVLTLLSVLLSVSVLVFCGGWFVCTHGLLCGCLTVTVQQPCRS